MHGSMTLFFCKTTWPHVTTGGWVTEVFPGKDGRVRKLKLLISDPTLDAKGKRISKPAYLERPIQKTVTLVEAD